MPEVEEIREEIANSDKVPAVDLFSSRIASISSAASQPGSPASISTYTNPKSKSISRFYNIPDDDNADALTLNTEEVGGRVSQSVRSSSHHIRPNVQFMMMIHGNPLLEKEVAQDPDGETTQSKMLTPNNLPEIEECGL